MNSLRFAAFSDSSCKTVYEALQHVAESKPRVRSVSCCTVASTIEASKQASALLCRRTSSFVAVQALPELLVLTDIKDLKNTLGLYRIALIFEGLVQFTTPEGNKVDAFQHKLRAEDAEFVRKHRHQDISSTVMLKEE